jgi:hypothetical protein
MTISNEAMVVAAARLYAAKMGPVSAKNLLIQLVIDAIREAPGNSDSSTYWGKLTEYDDDRDFYPYFGEQLIARKELGAEKVDAYYETLVSEDPSDECWKLSENVHFKIDEINDELYALAKRLEDMTYR